MTNPEVPGSHLFVEQLLSDRIGLDVASVGEGLIVRGVQNRMAQLGVQNLVDYHRILLGPSGELQALIEEVVIPESWFFRDDRPFATFREFVQAGWVDQAARAPVSILCLPCANGEEPYSVVMTLLELGLDRNRFEVVAIDVSEKSLMRAATGLYGDHSLRGLEPNLHHRYFDYTENRGRYLLKSSVRSAVRFELGNILEPTLLQQHTGFDIVFCRNLLIYFDMNARAKAFANLNRLTAENGLLFLGHADRPDQDKATQFVPFADKGSFVYRKQSAFGELTGLKAASSQVRPVTNPKRPITQSRLTNKPTRSPLRPTNSPGSQLQGVVDKGFGPKPQPDLPKQPPLQNGRSLPVVATQSETMTQAMSLADQGRYDEAAHLIKSRMGQNALDASAHFLLGLIHQAAGQRSEAEAELIKAIYLDPDHDEALLGLAALARRKGDMAAEASFRRRAERVQTRKEQH